MCIKVFPFLQGAKLGGFGLLRIRGKSIIGQGGNCTAGVGGGGGYEPLFPTPPRGGGGGGSSVGWLISANMALVVSKDTLVPGHFRLFSVTAPHQGLPVPYSESVCVNLRRGLALSPLYKGDGHRES